MAAFWAWWPEARPRIEAAIEARDFGPVMSDLKARVNAISERLDLELSSGLTSRHALSVSPRGNRTLRPLTERWLEAAPPRDSTWEFHAARLPSHRSHGELGGLVLAEQDYRIALRLDDRFNRLDVSVFHPGLATLPDAKRLIAISLFLCDLIGEDEAERWIGTFESALSPADDSVGVTGLRAEISRLRDAAVQRTQTIIQGLDNQGQPLSVLADLGMKRIDHVLYDQHVTISIRLEPGWPPPQSKLQQLDVNEEALEASLGHTALWVARTTEPGLREIHLVARDGVAACRLIGEWAASNQVLHATTRWEPDPEWGFRADWGGLNEARAKPRPRT
jgi:hypothetical protein